MDDKDLKLLLSSAIQHHNETLLEDLLANGSGSHLIDVPGVDGNTLLHLGVLERDVASIECLLKHGADPNVFDANRARTPFHLAIELDLKEIVKIFLNLDYVNLNLRDDRNLMCYEIAQFCDNQRLAELIGDRQDEIEQFKNGFYTVMNQACTNNDPKLVKTLLEGFEQRILEKLPKSWQTHKKGRSHARASLKEMINWSSSSWNDVTLLFKSASKGHTKICNLLIEFGASAKCNESTNYSPLYVAAYGGYTDTVKLLLDNFPFLIQEVTIEKWTVLHACCLQGHSSTARLILNYDYPESLKGNYVSRSGMYEYCFSFNLNAQDAAGQTAIYLAVSANNESLLDTLLSFKIEANSIQLSNQQRTTNKFASINDSRPLSNNDQAQDKSVIVEQSRIIPERSKLRQDAELTIKGQPPNNQVVKIIRQLQRLKLKNSSSSKIQCDSSVIKSQQVGSRQDATCIKMNDSDKYLICPFEMDTYCDYNSKTALQLTVCKQYHNIATTLLVNGADPNLPILFRDTINKSASDSNGTSITSAGFNGFAGLGGDIGLNWLKSSKSTCLKEACRLNDETMCEILIRYGARDTQENLALQVAASNKNDHLISMFLSLKSNIDPEHKINRKCNVEFAARYKQTQRMAKNTATITTFSSMFPSTPVAIDWRNLRCIKQIDLQWLIDASLQHNKRLRHPTNSLMAITRLDLSCNNLKSVHPVIFRLPSLRELNLSSNRLESLLDLNQLHSFKHRVSNAGTNMAATPTSKLIESHRIAMKRSKSSNLSGVDLESSNLLDLNEPHEWDLPCLEVLDLQDNLLISLPDCLFELPKLVELNISSNQLRQLPWAIWTAPSLKEMVASSNLLDDLPRAPPLSHISSSSPHSLFDAPTNDLPSDEKNSLSSYQSFDKLESSFTNSSVESEANNKFQVPDNSSGEKYLKNLNVIESQVEYTPTEPTHLNHWSKRIEMADDNPRLQEKEVSPGQGSNNEVQLSSKLTYLNLSHNSFSCVPPILACVTTELTRLNLANNNLKSLGDICLIPSKLKNLDLSNNELASWFSQAQHEDDTKCFTELLNRCSSSSKLTHKRVSQGGNLQCPHKAHSRLDCLKSLNLSHNKLKSIELYQQISKEGQQKTVNISKGSRRDSSTSPMPLRNQLLFPNLTALDMSFNQIGRVPENLSDLKDLSVLNLSGNVSVSSLPAELGLASKLWNLGLNGCNLGEPLKSIIESKTNKTMDIIGYLKSILEEAKPYARMKLMLVGLQGIGKTSLLEQMRLEGNTSGSGSRRRAPEHWTKRMGHASRSNLKNQKGVFLSTVGVDIHNWTFHKRTSKNEPNFGPVSFSTWDFGGQEEFYATHRYFLSRRSMYLVVWRLTDGLQGIQGIQQWLVNIQSRAPGSPVIIVGTHEDMVEGGERGLLVQELQSELYSRFINVSDHDRCGLPRISDCIVVSTKTKLNIKNLCNRIYDVVFSLKCPGSTERLLEQKIPATYLYLEDIVSSLVHERQQKKREPVITYDEYRRLTSEQLKSKHNKQFRDLEPLNSREINYNSELQQATRFLHENGVLLHYEDANLRNLYFLDPQWLCDILSHVVTIREINPHVKRGLMKIDDLGHLFKSMDIQVSGGVQSYVVNLLNKFEVALTWNSQYLLIPSLLPQNPDAILSSSSSAEAPITSYDDRFQVKLTPRMRGRSAVRRPIDSNQQNRCGAIATGLRAASIDPARKRAATNNQLVGTKNELKNFYEFECDPNKAIARLVLLRYLPAGFFARLQSSLLSEPTFDDICEDLQLDLLNKLVDQGNQVVEETISLLGNRPGWLCWKNGIRLSLQKESTINTNNADDHLKPPCLLSIQEYSSSAHEFATDKLNLQIECLELNQVKQQQQYQQADSDGAKVSQMVPTSVEVVGSKWNKFDHGQYSNVLIIVVPKVRLRVTNKEYRSVDYTVEFSNQNIARLLAKAVDHIDNLLEDWYPSLGARFAHTLGGNYLVSRVVLCQGCCSSSSSLQSAFFQPEHQKRLQANSRQSRQARNQVKLTINSTGGDNIVPQASEAIVKMQLEIVHCFYVEHCILNAYNLTPLTSALNNPQQSKVLNLKYLTNNSSAPTQNNNSRRKFARNLYCPKHGPIALSSVAPDIVFDDIVDSLKIDNDQIERCKLIGRGALGFIFKGTIHSFSSNLNQLGQTSQEVALKLLQPVEPGAECEQADLVAYNSARTNWTREPFQSACKSYCSARHEINILQALCHPNIVQFFGLCLRPLAIVLELAPLGSLEEVFRNYKRSCRRIDQYTVQKTILQISRALEFLHQHRIIYRDLKTENVLVFSFPSPFATKHQCAQVDLKLADYGISRQALSTGIWKGFAGTINFLAPEILRHNGDEEYTEKVDCFSFGMLMYELLTLRPPFEQQRQAGCGRALEPTRRSYLSELDVRPTLNWRDLIYPNYFIDLMSVCWSQEPHDRPTASQIVSIASAPEFMHVIDATTASTVSFLQRDEFACAIYYEQTGQLDLWCFPLEGAISVSSSHNGQWESAASIEMISRDGLELLQSARITAACVVDDVIWLFDSKQSLMHTFPSEPLFLGPSRALQQHELAYGANLSEQTREKLMRISTFPIDFVGTLESRATSVKQSANIKQMLHVARLNCLVLLADDGQLWWLNLMLSANSNNNNNNNNNTLTCRQLEDGCVRFNCITLLDDDTKLPAQQLDGVELNAASRIDCFQLFCGQSDAISWLEISALGQVRRHSILPLASRELDTNGEQVVEAPKQSCSEVSLLVAKRDHLWTAAGCTVHLWSCSARQVIRRLDCWKLVPCSESLDSINIEHYYQQASASMITALVCVGDQLFAGTSHGCCIVIEASSLKPIIVFRPYESAISLLKPMCNSNAQMEAPQLISIGRGYRDLLARYVSSLDKETMTKADDQVVAGILSAQNNYNI